MPHAPEHNARPTKKSVLITGCSSGFGLESTLELAKRGWHVFASMRDLSKTAALEGRLQDEGISLDDVTTLQLDVTDENSVTGAIRLVDTATDGRLDALVNNAGIASAGAFEDSPPSEWQKVFETNLFGTFRVTQAVIPLMRRQHNGRIVFISSNSAMSGNPALSLYCSTKWALEGWAESIAYEIEPFGIKLSLIQPGTYNTEIWKSTARITPPESAYSGFATILEKYVNEEELPRARDPKEVAKLVTTALTAQRPRFRYAAGPDAKINAALAKLPYGIQAAAIRRLTHLNKWKVTEGEPIINLRDASESPTAPDKSPSDSL